MFRRLVVGITDIFVPLLIVLLPFTLPLFSFDFDVGTILTITSIFFTILVGFFLAAATSNYLRLQTLISDLNAGMISLYNLASLSDSGAKKPVADAIDEYMIATLDYDLLHFAAGTEGEFQKVVTTIDGIRPTNDIGAQLVGNLHDQKTKLYSTHQEMALAAKTIVGPRHWFILISLAFIVAVLTLSLRENDLFVSVMSILLLSSIYQVLKLLHEVDTNLFLARKLAYENPQQVFRIIGRLPYYPQYALRARNVTAPKGSYRIGIYKNPSHSFEKEIQIVG